MTIDLDELERLAKAATPGPWFSMGEFDTQHVVRAADAMVCSTLHGSDEANANFIAAANPESVLALVERVRELERVARGALELTDMEDTRQHEAIRDALGID